MRRLFWAWATLVALAVNACPSGAQPIFSATDILGPTVCARSVVEGPPYLAAFVDAACVPQAGETPEEIAVRFEKLALDIDDHSPQNKTWSQLDVKSVTEIDMLGYGGFAAAIGAEGALVTDRRRRLIAAALRMACHATDAGSGPGELARFIALSVAKPLVGQPDAPSLEIARQLATDCGQPAPGEISYNEALHDLQTAIVVASQRQDLRAVARWRHLAGIIIALQSAPNAVQQAQAQLDMAEAALIQAKALAPPPPDNLSREEARKKLARSSLDHGQFERDERTLYVDEARLKLLELETVAVADRDYSKIIDILERGRAAFLRSRFNAACDDKDRSLGNWRPRSNELLIYPLVLEDRLEIFTGLLVDKKLAWRRSTASIHRDQLATLVVGSLHIRNTDRREDVEKNRTQLSQQLFETRFESNAGELASIGDWLHTHGLNVHATLIVVPEGPLALAPWPALPLRPQGSTINGAPLVESAATVIEPSLALMRTTSMEAHGRMMAAFPVKQIDENLPLEGAKQESLRFVGCKDIKSCPQAKLLKIADKEALFKELTKGGVSELLLSTHAGFTDGGGIEIAFAQSSDEENSRPRSPFLPIEDLRDRLKVARLKGGGLQILILSACETAVGSFKAPLGLAGAALEAGVDNVIASLIKISDGDTAHFVPLLAPASAQSRNGVLALQAATLAWRRAPSPDSYSTYGNAISEPLSEDAELWAKDFVWSNFVAVGAWR